MMQVVDELNEAIIELSFWIKIMSTVIIDKILTLLQFHEFFMKLILYYMFLFCFLLHSKFVKLMYYVVNIWSAIITVDMIWIQNDNSTGVASNLCKTYANVFIFFWMKGFLPSPVVRPTAATSTTTDLMTLLKVHTTRRAT